MGAIASIAITHQIMKLNVQKLSRIQKLRIMQLSNQERTRIRMCIALVVNAKSLPALRNTVNVLKLE